MTVAPHDGLHVEGSIAGARAVWIRRGNCSMVEIESIPRAHRADLLAFETDAEGAFLALG